MNAITDDLEARLREGPETGSGVTPALARFRRSAADDQLVDVAYGTVDSPVGELVVAATTTGVVAVAWDEAMLEVVAAKVSPRILELPVRVDDARRQLDEYFAGRRTRFEVPLDLSLSAGFRLQTGAYRTIREARTRVKQRRLG